MNAFPNHPTFRHHFTPHTWSVGHFLSKSKGAQVNVILERVKRNPVVVLDVVKALVVLATLFGLPLPPGVDVAVAGLAVAVLSLVTRQAVTPNATVEQAVDEALNTPAPELVPIPTDGGDLAEDEEAGTVAL